MNIEELTLKDLRVIGDALFPKRQKTEDTVFWEIGKNYFIRTVTHHHTGTLVSLSEHEVVLIGAAWIADDGRFTDALKSGVFNEVEMFPNRKVLVGRESIIDAVELTTPLPTAQK